MIMNSVRRLPILLAALFTLTVAASPKPLSGMDAEEIRAMLAACPVAVKESGAESSSTPLRMPLRVTAEDMVTKIYGVLDADCTRDECVSGAQTVLDLTPVEDLGALWLETSGGFVVDYSGMQPEMAAMARYEDDSLNDFGFFFIFPYSEGDKDASTRSQVSFCGSLLQELYDLGADLDQNRLTDDLFEAIGEYDGNYVVVRLIDDAGHADGGRYVLVLSVEPEGFTPADSTLAEL